METTLGPWANQDTIAQMPGSYRNGSTALEALPRRAMANVIPLHRDSFEQHTPFIKALKSVQANEAITITCIDYREGKREGYLLTSAGNIPHPKLLDDLHLVLDGKKALILRCHSDCAKSKSEVKRKLGEALDVYLVRVEAHTLERLWKSTRELLADPAVKKAVRDGLLFCAAKYDVVTGETTYFEEESNRLVKQVVRQPHEMGKFRSALKMLSCGLLA